MDAIADTILAFFGQLALPLLLPFLLMSVLIGINGGRPDRMMKLGFWLLEAFVVGTAKVLGAGLKALFDASTGKRSGTSRRSPSKPTPDAPGKKAGSRTGQG